MHPYERYFPVRNADDRLDVVSVLIRGLDADPGRIILRFENESWTAARMGRRVQAIRAWLLTAGVSRGDRVAVMLHNHPDHVALIYALILAGVVWVPVNTRFKAPGIAYLLDHAQPALFIAESAFEPEVCAAFEQSRHPARRAVLPSSDAVASPSDAVASTAGEPLPAIDPHEPLCIIYTSGTTGAPKGVIFTHRMMRIASEAALRVSDARSGDHLFLWEPLCHIGGAQMLLVPFMLEADLFLAAGFSVSRFWEQIAASGATQLHYLGGILDLLMKQPESSPPPRHCLRVAWGAGMAAQAWHPTRRRMGFALRECYGMTEGSSFATMNATDKPGSIGKAMPWIRLELLDGDDQPVADGETGQIVLSSDVDGIFLPCYLENPQATAQVLRDGKLYTGDVGRLDADGDLTFVGRASDSMRVRGENVSAWEVERIFATHPLVAAVAAIGVQGNGGEQEIMLYVQPRPGGDVDFNDLSAWADPLLASFQRPRYYVQVANFELTPSERIRKHVLPRDIEPAWDRQQQGVPALRDASILRGNRGRG